MAIKVSGTTVVDDSRNLQNLVNLNTSGNVYANTFVGDADQLTNLPASGGSFEAIASGTLSDGSTVVVNADGTVSVVDPAGAPLSETLGSKSRYDSSTEVGGDYSATFDTNENKVVIAYYAPDSSNTKCVVGTVSGTSITFGSPVEVTSGGGNIVAVFDSNENKVVVAYDASGAKAKVGTVSGTSISFGSATTIESSGWALAYGVFDSNENKVVFSYRRGSDGVGSAIVGNVSGTSISFGSRVQLGSGGAISNATLAFDSNSNKVVASYRNNYNSNYGTTQVGTVSGTSISFGTAVVFLSAELSQAQNVFDTLNNKIVTVFRGNTGSGVKLNAIVGTVSGTSISYGSAGVILNADSAGTTGAEFDPTNNKVVVYYYHTDNDEGYIQSGTVSGTSISFGSQTTLGIIQDPDGIMRGDQELGIVYDTNEKKIVFIYTEGTFDEYGQAKVYQPAGFTTNLTSENFIGISNGAYANNTTATIQIKGAVDDAQSGLTPGQQYFVQANGSINTTAADPSVFAGTAIASNKLIVKG